MSDTTTTDPTKIAYDRAGIALSILRETRPEEDWKKTLPEDEAELRKLAVGELSRYLKERIA